MNVLKFRPVGQPNGRVVRVKVTQTKRAIYGGINNRGKRFRPCTASVGTANKIMMRKGFVRAGRPL